MTDEQLTRMARRIRYAYSEAIMVVDLEFAAKLMKDGDDFDATLDAAAVAIIREELAKAEAENRELAELIFPFVPHTDGDDPTQSFVTTTE
jgi:hypothetical protein